MLRKESKVWFRMETRIVVGFYYRKVFSCARGYICPRRQATMERVSVEQYVKIFERWKRSQTLTYFSFWKLFWNEQIVQCFSQARDHFDWRNTTAPQERSLKVLLSSLPRISNEMVCANYFLFDEVRLFDAIYTIWRYSVCSVVEKVSVRSSILSFHSCWIGQFGIPAAIHVHKAFGNI